MTDKELEETIKTKFRNLSTPALIRRMEAAPDFGYDDEEIELKRRLNLKGQDYVWEPKLSNPKIIVISIEERKELERVGRVKKT